MHVHDKHQPSRISALMLRSAALCMILYQFRLFANDLADTPIFIIALITAFTVSCLLALKKIPAIWSLPILALIPWIARCGVAFPRMFFPETAVALDSLLLNLDRNTFIFIIPFYWAELTTYFSVRSRTFLRADIIAADTLFLVLFSITPTIDIQAYRWPVLMIALFILILFLQILALIFSIPPEFKLRKRECLGAVCALLVLIIIGGLLFLRPSQERAIDRGGGLLEPNLLSFDFSQFLHLESEISTNDDLVFIVKKDPNDPHILFRRYVLSGYTTKQGFFRYEPFDETAHPQRLPETRTRLPVDASIKAFRITEQEYFLVNFDSSAFIGMNEPIEITPFETWDASSFSSAYAVQSHTSDALPFELLDAIQGNLSASTFGFSPEEYAFYTEYGKDERLSAFAQEVTYGFDSYWDKVQVVYEYLKYGEYRYSFKPGIAPNGDQLGFFLFQSKKGYCSYYAFSMALLLRSLGIPTRVAAGFFIEPETNTFNYYPVRSNMAHAWVEVYYPGYGWIEYDPTTQILAEGEEFRFSSGVPEEFERLMKEILDNHARLNPKDGYDDTGTVQGLAALGAHTIRFLKTYWYIVLIPLLAISFVFIRIQYLVSAKLSRSHRRKADRLWVHARRLLYLGGYKRRPHEAEAEWAKNLNCSIAGVYPLYQAVGAARYGPEYSLDQFKALQVQYAVFSGQYRKKVSLGRRILTWVLPPLALILRPTSQLCKKRARRTGKAAGILLILVFALARDTIEARDANEDLDLFPDTIYNDALEAQRAEYWERAIELYTLGSELYPDEVRFPWALGNLYYHRRLYGLAWNQYLMVEKLFPDNTEVLYQLSRTAGYLNNTEVAVEYLERILDLEPDNKEAIGNLGWMYYKLHRLREGQVLLQAALDRFGTDPDFFMTLGTIYSDMFQYEDAKKCYLEAIAGAEILGDRLFAAVTHYNLSILETRFYHYDLAFDRTNAALSSQNRASGRLARGELFLRRLEFKHAFSDYQVAYEIDTSPLSKVNLAQSYQIAGRLEEARVYAEDCLRAGDLSWMLNYGIDPVRYKRDLHEILYKVYAGFEHAERFTVYRNMKEWIWGITRRVSYQFKKDVHQNLFRKYSLLSAHAYNADIYATKEPNLDALIQYYNAFDANPKRALTYLNQARNFEVPLIPESEASYNYEQGRLLKNWDVLNNTIRNFDPLWERDMIALVYIELAQMKGIDKRRAAAEQLYTLNRGGLRQYGITLPVELSITVSEELHAARIQRYIRKAVKTIGIDPVRQDQGTSSRFQLRIRVQGQETVCELYDQEKKLKLFNHTIPLPSLSATSLSFFAQTLGDFIFTAE